MTMIDVYKTSNRKLARSELKRNGIKPYTPPAFGGIVAADAKPINSIYVKSKIGRVRRDEYARMYGKGRRKRAFSIGDKALIKKERCDVPAVVVEVNDGDWYTLGVDMMGKRFLLRMREEDIARPGKSPYDPG